MYLLHTDTTTLFVGNSLNESLIAELTEAFPVYYIFVIFLGPIGAHVEGYDQQKDKALQNARVRPSPFRETYLGLYDTEHVQHLGVGGGTQRSGDI